MDRHQNPFEGSKEAEAYPLIQNNEPFVGDKELASAGYPSLQERYLHQQGGDPPTQGLYPPLPSVIINQPTGKEAVPSRMSIPRDPACPPGLEYLTKIDQLLVHQEVELLEIFTGYETENKYTIKNRFGQKVYYAGEDSNCCARNCCGPFRPFDMKILDNFGNYVMNLYRPLACSSCFCPCCLQSMEVNAPPGTVIGTIEQTWSILFPKFVVKNSVGEVVSRIEGPFFTSSCCCRDVEFKVLSADGKTQVGKISKQWSGLPKEIFTDADNLGVTFPMDLDVRMKATMLGACFLIDMMFFEGDPTNVQAG